MKEIRKSWILVTIFGECITILTQGPAPADRFCIVLSQSYELLMLSVHTALMGPISVIIHQEIKQILKICIPAFDWGPLQ
jgi:hypothetical protein